MDPPRLRNHTDFVAAPVPLYGKEGEVLTTIVKATFAIAEDGALDIAPAASTRPLRYADEPWGAPERSSIKYPADSFINKPGSDVIVVAAGYPEGGEPVSHFDVLARLGPKGRPFAYKTLRVFGLRVWQVNGKGLSAPRPTAGDVAIRYDWAWGGLDDSDPERVVVEDRNPVGMGVARDPAALTDRPAPCLEDPAQLIASVATRPPPAGLGVIGRHWSPRRHYVGSYDDAWLEQRAPLIPLDQDPRFELCGSPGLSQQAPLPVGEEVALYNLTPGGGALTFRLPPILVQIDVQVKGREPVSFRPPCDTVIIDTLHPPPGARATVEMVWRAGVPAPRRLRDATIEVREEELS